MGLRIIICAKEDFESQLLKTGEGPFSDYLLTEEEAGYLFIEPMYFSSLGLQSILTTGTAQASAPINNVTLHNVMHCSDVLNRAFKAFSFEKHSRQVIKETSAEHAWLSKLLHWLEASMREHIDLETKAYSDIMALRESSRRHTAMIYVVDIVDRTSPTETPTSKEQ